MRFASGSYHDGVPNRLVSIDAAGQGAIPVRTTLSYEDESAPDAWTRRENWAVDGSMGSGEARTFADGKVATASSFNGSGTISKSWKHVYVAGHVDVVERDGGYWAWDVPDGTPNMRFKWQRDSAGTVIEFTQDGTDSNDNPFVNGKPDYRQTYSAGCRPLLEQFPWLAHEPRPDAFGPRFRTDRFTATTRPRSG